MRSLIFLMALLPCAARDYYFHPSGNDSGPGDKARPWRSLAKAAGVKLLPGDRLLLAGGAVFAGPLNLTDTAAIVESYGEGRAIIDGGTGGAIQVSGGRDVHIRNLQLRGAGRKTGNTASGLVVKNSTGVEIDRIEVSGFRSSGVYLDGATDARLTRIHAHENGYAGIASGGATSRKLYVADCLAENNPGDPTVRKNHSGNGIVIGRAKDVLIERCEARYNGWDMPWTGNGPVGIWTHDADNVTIQHCVAHHNRSTAKDGGGFDFDGAVTNSVLQYNYSHDNFGTGFLICQYKGAGEFSGNVVRYNISQDDGLFDHDGGILVWVGGHNMKSTVVYNNTIFSTKGSGVVIDVDKGYEDEIPDLRFYNNIFVSRGPQISTREKNLKRVSDTAKFAGNVYWSVGDRGFNVDGFTDFGQWAAATGQETIDGRVVGRYADPLLQKDGAGLLSTPDSLASLHEYKILPGSAAIDAGIDLRKLFGIDPGKRDFYGGKLPSGSRFDAGAHEFFSGSGQPPGLQ